MLQSNLKVDPERSVLSYQEAYSRVSSKCKDLVLRLLDRDTTKRPTAEECLRDPWFQDFSNLDCCSAPTNNSNLNNLNLDSSLSHPKYLNNFKESCSANNLLHKTFSQDLKEAPVRSRMDHHQIYQSLSSNMIADKF
jgi:serine/threonine protein kinase